MGRTNSAGSVYGVQPREIHRNVFARLLIQETNFPFEVFVHDDASTDESADIIRRYAERYPLILKPVYESENQCSKKDGSIFRTTWQPVIQGDHKYIALCEGDDYWTDPKKLQKQVEYMESHPGCAGCVHERGTGDAEAEGRPIPGAELSNEIRNGDREALGPTTSYVYVGFHPNSTGSCALTFLVLRPRVSAWGMGPFMLSTRGQTACRPRRFRLEGKVAVVAISFLKMWTSSLLACCPHAPGDGFSRSQRQARPCLLHRTNPVVDS